MTELVSSSRMQGSLFVEGQLTEEGTPHRDWVEFSWPVIRRNTNRDWQNHQKAWHYFTILNLSKSIITSRVGLRELEESVDWDRWHELRDIRSERELTPKEADEYSEVEAIVAKLDEEEEQVGSEAIARLASRQEKVIRMIRELTDAIKIATDRAD